MSFESFGAFLAMGEHALYVWLSYGIAAATIIYNIGVPIWRRRRLLAEQRQRLRRAERPPAEPHAPVNPPSLSEPGARQD